MSKITWSDVIASIDLSDKTVRNPRKLSQDEIADIKVKCNPKYDLTIMDLVCTIEALQQENEQLRAQAARMREAIKEYVEYMEYVNTIIQPSIHQKANRKEIKKVKELLESTPYDYHNPADVEALRKAREALFDYKTFLESFQCGCEPSDETCPGVYCERCCRLNQANETLDEVDKAIGGKTDV